MNAYLLNFYKLCCVFCTPLTLNAVVHIITSNYIASRRKTIVYSGNRVDLQPTFTNYVYHGYSSVA